MFSIFKPKKTNYGKIIGITAATSRTAMMPMIIFRLSFFACAAFCWAAAAARAACF